MTNHRKWALVAITLTASLLVCMIQFKPTRERTKSPVATIATLAPQKPAQSASKALADKLQLNLKIASHDGGPPGSSDIAIVSGDAEPLWGTTDPNGSAIVEIPLREFPMSLRVFAGQRTPGSVKWLWENRIVSSAADPATHWELTYSRQSILRGVVVDSAGAGLKDYPIALWPSFAKGGSGPVYPIFNRLCQIGLAPLNLKTDESGRFAMEGIHPDVALSFRHGPKEGALRIEFTDLLPIRTKHGVDGVSEYSIKLIHHRLSELAISVRDSNDAPVKGALVKTRVARVDNASKLLDTRGPAGRTNGDGVVVHPLPVLNAESPASLEGRQLWVIAWHDQYGLTYYSGRVSLENLEVTLRFPAAKVENAIRLSFIDKKTKEPVQGVTVGLHLELFGSPELATLKSDEAGIVVCDGFQAPPAEWWGLVGQKLQIKADVLMPFQVAGSGFNSRVFITPGESLTVEVVKWTGK
jgi:hypothetical protein